MNHIYHILTLIFILNELIWLFSAKEKAKKTEQWMKMHDKHKGKKWDDYTEEFKDLSKSRLPIVLMNMFWMLFGLITYNWVAFLIFLVFEVAIIGPLSKLTRYSFAYTVLHWINSLIGFVFGIFVLINAYHLRIDLLELVKAYFDL